MICALSNKKCHCSPQGELVSPVFFVRNLTDAPDDHLALKERREQLEILQEAVGVNCLAKKKAYLGGQASLSLSRVGDVLSRQSNGKARKIIVDWS